MKGVSGHGSLVPTLALESFPGRLCALALASQTECAQVSCLHIAPGVAKADVRTRFYQLRAALLPPPRPAAFILGVCRCQGGARCDA
eukprot:224650-Pyramimonas_sp.AAC.1